MYKLTQYLILSTLFTTSSLMISMDQDPSSMQLTVPGDTTSGSFQSFESPRREVTPVPSPNLIKKLEKARSSRSSEDQTNESENQNKENENLRKRLTQSAPETGKFLSTAKFKPSEILNQSNSDEDDQQALGDALKKFISSRSSSSTSTEDEKKSPLSSNSTLLTNTTPTPRSISIEALNKFDQELNNKRESGKKTSTSPLSETPSTDSSNHTSPRESVSSDTDALAKSSSNSPINHPEENNENFSESESEALASHVSIEPNTDFANETKLNLVSNEASTSPDTNSLATSTSNTSATQSEEDDSESDSNAGDPLTPGLRRAVDEAHDKISKQNPQQNAVNAAPVSKELTSTRIDEELPANYEKIIIAAQQGNQENTPITNTAEIKKDDLPRIPQKPVPAPKYVLLKNMAKALTAIGGFVGLLYYFDRLPNSMTETINVVVDSTKDNISIFLSKLLAMIPNLSSEKIITDSTEHSYNA